MINNKKALELLAPAKNYEFGVAAINCGADALYIGAPNFGARRAASNSVDDIAKLVGYAHLFNVKVYVAFNTIIYDNEIADAERLVSQLHEIGVDALIVQDMAFAKMSIPPIRLFASTQTANFTNERVEFLEKVGFERVILERALSLSEIESICRSTTVDIECFVHGAICVSYSGNCYISEAITGRSANRGECAQLCRSVYDLYDEDDNLLIKKSHLLSLKDLSLSHKISDLVEVGVSSFKIEGRLKDIVYLKNSVTHYNRILNEYIALHSDLYMRQSHGSAIVSFEPNVSKSFSRTFTPYFIEKREDGVASFASAKSLGEYIGVVKRSRARAAVIEKEEGVTLACGDGLCFISDRNNLIGSYVNGEKGDEVQLSTDKPIESGSKVYRNYDKRFVDQLTTANERRVLDCRFTIGSGVVSLECNNISISENFEADVAQNIARAKEGLSLNFSKVGGTIFNVINLSFECDTIPFLPIKMQNNLRTSLFDRMVIALRDGYCYDEGVKLRPTPLTLISNDTYKLNVANSLSRSFYSECGLVDIDDALELSGDFDGKELMRMAYCLRREMSLCTRSGNRNRPFYLVNNGRRFRAEFDCSHCEMVIYQS